MHGNMSHHRHDNNDNDDDDDWENRIKLFVDLLPRGSKTEHLGVVVPEKRKLPIVINALRLDYLGDNFDHFDGDLMRRNLMPYGITFEFAFES